jgi:phosphate transport system substrate-binding protein
MSPYRATLCALALAAAALAAPAAAAREQIRIVGSSTVFPFSAAVAEHFGRTTAFRTPVVEATGSGGGIKLFCAGVGTDTPDIANASRRMKPSEFRTCQANGVSEVIEAPVGFDGIVVAGSRAGPRFALTRAQLVTALAEQGPKPARWNEVDPSLPAVRIEVLGPPPSSGTRDAFEELVLHEGCKDAGIACEGITIRADGAWVDAGENDNLIVSKLEANPNALGVFGFSFLDQNADKLAAASVDGVEPSFENIAGGAYPVARSLYFYLKGQHLGVIPGLAEFAAEFLSDAAAGPDGYLLDKGLIPLPADRFHAVAAAVKAGRTLAAADF